MLEYVWYRDGERFERWKSEISIYVMTSRPGISGRRSFLRYPFSKLDHKISPKSGSQVKEPCTCFVHSTMLVVCQSYQPMDPDDSTRNVQLWSQKYVHRKGRMKIHNTCLEFSLALKSGNHQTPSREANDCRIE